jgi:predicted secreted protein
LELLENQPVLKSEIVLYPKFKLMNHRKLSAAFAAIGLCITCMTHTSCSTNTNTKPTPPNPVGASTEIPTPTPPTPPGEKTGAKRSVVQLGCTNQLTITRGQILTLKLPATAGTGYLWLLSQASPLLKQEKANTLNFEKVAQTDKAGKVGSQQYQVLTFEALTAGQVTLNWEYLRPTDPKSASNKCAMQVTIQQ